MLRELRDRTEKSERSDRRKMRNESSTRLLNNTLIEKWDTRMTTLLMLRFLLIGGSVKWIKLTLNLKLVLLITKPTNPIFGLNWRGGVGLGSHLDIAWDSLTHWGTLCTLRLLGNSTQDRAGAKRPLGLLILSLLHVNVIVWQLL